MLSSLRAIAPRGLQCCLRVPPQSGRRITTKAQLQYSRVYFNYTAKSQFHTSFVQREASNNAARREVYEDGNDVDEHTEKSFRELPQARVIPSPQTAKEAVMSKLSTSTKRSTTNAEGLETSFHGLLEKGLVNKIVIDNITKGMGYDTMTDVQQKTIVPSLGSRDM